VAAWPTGFATRRGDAFATLEALAVEGARFDLVICDPPAFAPSKQAPWRRACAPMSASRGWPPPWWHRGGYADPVFLFPRRRPAASSAPPALRGIGRAGRAAQLHPHRLCRAGSSAALPQLAETGYLKALAFRLMP
jgi:23S rRNA (cytosine1962-C5)-methyltransferase